MSSRRRPRFARLEWLAALASPALPAAAQGLQATPAASLHHAAPGPADHAGGSVALDGDRALIGIQWSDAAAPDGGAAVLFERQGDGSWPEVAQLVPADSAAGDWAGTSVAVDGERAVVGAKYGEPAGAFQTGSAYVFERQASGVWLQAAELTAPDAAIWDSFGFSAAISADRILIGAAEDDTEAGFGAGSAHVFERQTDGSWLHVVRLTALDASAQDSFGIALDVDADRVLIGAPWADPEGLSNAGAAYVFERGPTGAWSQVAKLQADAPAAGDEFANAVELDGDRALIGARFDDTAAGADAGSAHVFERQADGTWLHAARLEAGDAAAFASFGTDVSLAAEHALIGAQQHPSGAVAYSGAAYLFERQAGGTWAEAAELTHAEPAAVDLFGASVSLAGDRALIGVWGEDLPGALEAGGAELFRLCDGCLAPFGTGSSGCGGAHELTANLPPETGAAGFELTCSAAPAGAVGFLGLADAADVAGSDLLGLGVLLHVDLLASSYLFVLPMPSAGDTGMAALPLPADASLVGAVVIAQALWTWSSCSLPPYGLSSSPGLAITILAP